MATPILMPKLGFDMEEGTLIAWLKLEGDTVQAGETIAEIETDKAIVELEAPADGVLSQILVQPGQSVPVNTPIAHIEQSDFQPSKQKSGPEPVLGSTVKEERSQGQTKVTKITDPSPENLPGDIRATPAARRLAREYNLDLSQITGSGPGGRIQLRDVKNALAQAEETQPPPPSQGSSPEKITEIPLSPSRRRIAQRMVASKGPVPHFYVTMSVDMDATMALRQELNECAAGETDIRISVNHLIIKAVALALRQFPSLNASLKGETLVQHPRVHMGIAVALPEGPITVVLQDPEIKPLGQIAREVREKVQRARHGKLQPDDLAESTFTISNLGMYGVENFIAVITPPETAILAIGAVQERPVVRDGIIRPGQVMTMTLSADHRVTDGAEAAQFLRTVKTYLEHPLKLVLASIQA